MNERSDRLAEEQRWYQPVERQEHWAAVRLRRVLQGRPFNHPDRARFAYGLIDEQLRAVLLECSGRLPEGPILNLPSGDGYDYPVLEAAGRRIVGADLSYTALLGARVRAPHPCVCCDSIQLPFRDGTFALVVIDKFLHHVVDDGFDPYLQECYRVLRPGGAVVIQEPSILYPVNSLTAALRLLLRRAFGYELLGHVPHERPFRPAELRRSLRRVGFGDVRIRGSSFVHNRCPVWLGRLVSHVQGPALRSPVTGSFAWWVVFWGWKSPAPAGTPPRHGGLRMAEESGGETRENMVA